MHWPAEARDVDLVRRRYRGYFVAPIRTSRIKGRPNRNTPVLHRNLHVVLLVVPFFLSSLMLCG
jgi:hypothetical protein